MAQLMKMPLSPKLLQDSNIRHFSVPISFISIAFFRMLNLEGCRYPCSLDTLHLDSIVSQEYVCIGSYLDSLWDAIADGQLGNLRRVNIHWPLAHANQDTITFDELNQYLKALAREDGQKAKFTEDQAGLWLPKR